MPAPLDTDARPLLLPLIIGFGAVCLATQSLVVRELMVSFYGTELALATALSCWLFFIPFGALAGGLALRWCRSPRNLALGGLHVLAGVMVVQFFTARMVRLLLGVQTGHFVPLVWMVPAAALSTGPAGFMVGFVFPAASAAGERGARVPAGGISGVYIAEALGSCICGALLSFVLLRWQSPTAIIVLLAAWLLALCGLWTFRSRAPGLLMLAAPLVWTALSPAAMTGSLAFAWLLAMVALGGLVGLAAGGVPRRGLRPWTCFSLGLAFLFCQVFLAFGSTLRRDTLGRRWRTFSSFNFLESRETQYQNIALGRREEMRVVLQNGLKGMLFPDERANAERAALLLTQHPRPRDVLVVGGGLGGLCQHMLEAPLRRLDYVEMDPALISLVFDHLPESLWAPLSGSRFVPYSCDGRYFVQAARRNPDGLGDQVYSRGIRAGGPSSVAPAGSYDLVVINVGDPASASANRFYTREFFGQVKRVLAPGGVAAVCGVTGSDTYLRGEVLDYTACIYRTLHGVFDRVVVRPGDELCFFAGGAGGSVTDDPALLAERFRSLGLQPPEMRFMFEMSQFPAERVKYVRESLERGAEHVTVNTDAHPGGFIYYLQVQEHYAGLERAGRQEAPSVAQGGLLAALSGLEPWWFLVAFGVVLVVLLVMRARFGPRRAGPCFSAFAIFTGGVFGISADVLIIYSYQTRLGFVYRDISILVGIFMLGLASGAWLMTKGVPGRAGKYLLLLECLQAALLLSLPGLVGRLPPYPWLYMLLCAAAGFLTGAEFPVACRIGLGAGRSAGGVASVFDACDHGGAVVGAATTGLVLMPLLGLAESAALLAAVKGSSLLGVLVHTVWGAGRSADGVISQT